MAMSQKEKDLARRALIAFKHFWLTQPSSMEELHAADSLLRVVEEVAVAMESRNGR